MDATQKKEFITRLAIFHSLHRAKTEREKQREKEREQEREKEREKEKERERKNESMSVL